MTVENPPTVVAGMPPSVQRTGDSAARDGGGGVAGVASPPVLVPRVREKLSIDECPGALSVDKVKALQAPDITPGVNRWLYPYEKTVFPRGLVAPVLQWDMPAPESLYIHMQSALFEYKGCAVGGTNANFAIPQTAWDKAGEQSNGPGDPLTIEVTLTAGGQSVRLPTLSLIFALATLKSAVYYNTYNSAIANAQGIASGVVMRTLPGRSKPDVFLSAPVQNGDCVGCHSVSADGSRLIAATSNNPNMGLVGDFGTTERPGASYDLQASGTGTQPAPVQRNLKRAGLAALYPDGSRYLGQGAAYEGPTPTATGLPFPANVWGTFGPETSKLFDTNTGAEIPNSGTVEYAYMPAFSMDGRMLVFNHMDQSGTAGHALAVLDFDRSQDKFSTLRQIYTSATDFPAWPFFLPDVVDTGDKADAQPSKRIVFAVGGTPDFATQDVYLLAQFPHPSDLWWLEVDSGKAAPLARANGQDTMGSTYLPYGERDEHKNYYPTVSPVAAGGYFWLFFTSKRNYGNLFVRENAEYYPEAKKIWVSAIDIDAPPGSDPSHPAFFLPGQELESGNIRAFAALDACRPEGNGCETGIDCCCGFCTDGTCACQMPTTTTTCAGSNDSSCKPATICSQLDEQCSTASDCCDTTLSCIGGFCGVRGPD